VTLPVTCRAPYWEAHTGGERGKAATEAANIVESPRRLLRHYLEQAIADAEDRLEKLGRSRQAWRSIIAHLTDTMPSFGGNPESQDRLLGPMRPSQASVEFRLARSRYSERFVSIPNGAHACRTVVGTRSLTERSQSCCGCPRMPKRPLCGLREGSQSADPGRVR